MIKPRITLVAAIDNTGNNISAALKEILTPYNEIDAYKALQLHRL